jgi:hypothetical protein
MNEKQMAKLISTFKSAVFALVGGLLVIAGMIGICKGDDVYPNVINVLGLFCFMGGILVVIYWFLFCNSGISNDESEGPSEDVPHGG